MTNEELRELQGQVCQTILALLPRDTAATIGKRLENLSKGAFLPAPGGFASTQVIAAMLGLSEHGVENRIRNTRPPQYGDGQTILYSVADVAKPRTPKRTKKKPT